MRVVRRLIVLSDFFCECGSDAVDAAAAGRGRRY